MGWLAPTSCSGAPGGDLFLESSGPSGADIFNGAEGSDTLDYAARLGPVAVRLDGAANDGSDPDRSTSSGAAEEGDQDLGIENATTGAGNDFLRGNVSVNTLGGRAGTIA